MARRTKSESALTREHILDAAEIEMQARGVAQTSLERIAKRANVTRGAIYWHFTDKSALLEAMIGRTHLPLRALRQCLSQHIPGDAPLPLLREMLLHGLNRLAHDARHRRVCHILLHRCETSDCGHPAQTALSAVFEEARGVMISLCTEIEERHQLRDDIEAADAADVLVAFMAGNYECALRHPDAFPRDRDWVRVVDSVLRGLVTPEAMAELEAPLDIALP